MSLFWLNMDHHIMHLVPTVLRGNSINLLGLNFETRKLLCSNVGSCTLDNYFSLISFNFN